MKGGSLGLLQSCLLPANSLKSPVSPQQIIKFGFENKEPGSMYKHINTALLCSRLLISRRNFCFLIEYEMYYFILVSSLSFFSQMDELAAEETAESKVPNSCLTSATTERLMTTVSIHFFFYSYNKSHS